MKKEKVKAVKADKVKRKIRLSIQWKSVLAGLAVNAAFMGLFFGYILPNLQNYLASKGLDVEAGIAAKRNEYIIICGILAVICSIFVFFFSRTIAGNIKKAANVANKLATGDVDQRLQIKSKDETGELGEALGKVLAYLQKMSDASERIVNGDPEVIVNPQSEKDTLNKNFSRIIANIKTSSEDRLRLEDYLNKIPMSIMVIDKEQQIQFINSACAGTILKKPQDCIGQKCNSLFHTDDCASGNCASMTAMKQDKACTMETIKVWFKVSETTQIFGWFHFFTTAALIRCYNRDTSRPGPHPLPLNRCRCTLHTAGPCNAPDRIDAPFHALLP